MFDEGWFKNGVKACIPLTLRASFWAGIYYVGPAAIISLAGVAPLIGTAIFVHSSLPELILICV